MLKSIIISCKNDRMDSLGRITAWHEGHQKFQVSSMNKRSELQIKKELIEANTELKVRRKERLKDLYAKEMALYEKELNEKGLAIFKDRP